MITVVLKANSGLKEIIKQPFIPGVKPVVVSGLGRSPPETETQYCSRRRAPSGTETAECVVWGVSPLTLVDSSRAALPAHPVAPRRDIGGSCLGVSPGVALDPPGIVDT